MKKLLLLVFTFCTAQLLTAQPSVDPAKLVGHMHTERSALLVSFYRNEVSRLDSSTLFQFADKLDRLAVPNKDTDLKWEAKLVRAHFHLQQGGNNDRVLQYLQEMAESNGPKWIKAHAENMLGHYFWDRLAEYELGLFHFARAADILKNENSMEYPYKHKFNYDVGTRLCDLSDYDNAIVYLRAAIESEIPKILGFDYRMHTFNSLGFTYRKLNMLDSSDYYFHRGYDLAIELNNADLLGVLAGNIGENLYIRKQFKEAIPFLRTDVSRCLGAQDWSSASNALTILGDIHLSQGNLIRAKELLDSALAFSHQSRQIKRLVVVYPRLAKLYAAKGDGGLAQSYIDSSLFANDSLIRENNRFSATRAQQRVRLDEMQANTLEQEFQFENRLQQRNYIVLVVLLIALILILFLNQRRLKAKLGQQVADKKRKQAEQNLEYAQQRLSDFVEQVQQLQQEITQHSDSEFFEPSLPKGNSSVLENVVIFTERQWREFTDLFESVHPGFFQRLNEKLPELTASEIRFFALSRMRLGNKEMASMLAISTDAVRQTRSRLKRKLALEVSLEQFALEV